MATCKKCNKNFHACFSCGLFYEREWDYCSSSCWDLSEEKEKSIKYIEEEVFNRLSPNAINGLHEFLINSWRLDLSDFTEKSNYTALFFEIYENRKKKIKE